MSAREQIRPQLENMVRNVQEARAERDRVTDQANRLEKTLKKYAAMPGMGRTQLTITGERSLATLRSQARQLDSTIAKAEEDYNNYLRLATSMGIDIAPSEEAELSSSEEEEPRTPFLSDEELWDINQLFSKQRCQERGEPFYWQQGSFETRETGRCLERPAPPIIPHAPQLSEELPPPIPAFPSELLGLRPTTSSEEEEFAIPPPPRVDRDECLARGAPWFWERNHCINTEERQRCLDRGAPYVWERNRCVRKRGARKSAAGGAAEAAMATPSGIVRRPPALVLSPGSATMIPTPSYYGRRRQLIR